MKASEIRSMTPEQLNEKLVGLKKDLFYLRMQHATNQLDNPLKIRETKHDIARVKTMLRQKEHERREENFLPQDPGRQSRIRQDGQDRGRRH